MGAEVETGAAEEGRDGGGLPLSLVIGGWGLAALATLVVGEFAGMRFLDLPLGAFVAGQGALVSLVVVGVRIALPSDRGAR
jgi:uncharacterized membrane protein